MNDDSLTVEKLKLNERLQGVETQVALLKASIDELKNTKNEFHSHLESEIDLFRKLIYGTDVKDGMLISVNDLEKASQNRVRHLTVIYSVIISLLIHSIWRHFILNEELSKIHVEEKK